MFQGTCCMRFVNLGHHHLRRYAARLVHRTCRNRSGNSAGRQEVALRPRHHGKSRTKVHYALRKTPAGPSIHGGPCPQVPQIQGPGTLGLRLQRQQQLRRLSRLRLEHLGTSSRRNSTVPRLPEGPARATNLATTGSPAQHRLRQQQETGHRLAPVSASQLDLVLASPPAPPGLVASQQSTRRAFC